MERGKNCKLRTILFLMELPITNKDLDTIISALSLGGDARLYHLLKNHRDDVKLQKEVFSDATPCDI